MVSQVHTVSILMIVYGAIMSLVGVGLGVLGAIMFISVQAGPANPNERFSVTMVGIGLLVGGLVILTVGVLHIISGIRCMKFQGRTLALVALFMNILTLPFVYCAIFEIGMAVFGLIVLFDKDVIRAFAMAENGSTPEDILEEFRPRYYSRRRRRDYDDDRDDDRSSDRSRRDDYDR